MLKDKKFQGILTAWLSVYEGNSDRTYSSLALLITLYDTETKIYAVEGDFPIDSTGEPDEERCKRFYKKWSSPVLEAFHSRGGQRVFPSTVRYLTHTCNGIYLKHILP